MAPKKRPKTAKKAASNAKQPVSILTVGALEDLRYLEPVRTRNRVINIFEELFVRLERMERLHRDEEHG